MDMSVTVLLAQRLDQASIVAPSESQNCGQRVRTNASMSTFTPFSSVSNIFVTL